MSMIAWHASCAAGADKQASLVWLLGINCGRALGSQARSTICKPKEAAAAHAGLSLLLAADRLLIRHASVTYLVPCPMVASCPSHLFL